MEGHFVNFVILLVFPLLCVTMTTGVELYEDSSSPYHFSMDSLVISATQEDSRVKCALKCHNDNICVAFMFGFLDPTVMADECYTGASHLGYRGHQNISHLGRTCQAWTSNSPHVPSYRMPAEHANYCRDPSSSGYNWCYTTDPNKRWDYCDIAKCYPDTNCRLFKGPIPAAVYRHPRFRFYT